MLYIARKPYQCRYKNIGHTSSCASVEFAAHRHKKRSIIYALGGQSASMLST